MPLVTGGTLGGLFLEVTAADARALPGPELGVRWTLANDWSAPTRLARGDRQVLLQVDAQSDALVLSGRLPWTRLAGPAPAWRRLATTVEARLVATWGGFTDRPIEAWHRLAGFDRFERPLHPRGAVRVEIRDAATGEGLSLGSSRLAAGDVAVRTQLLLAEGGVSHAAPERARWGVSARLDLKVPVGRPERLGGSGGWDAGAALLGTAELAPWATAHALVAAVAVSRIAAPVPLRPRPWRGAAELSLALRAGAFTIVLQDRISSAIFDEGFSWIAPAGGGDVQASATFGAFLPQNRVSVGIRRGTFTFWVSEDWTPGAAPRVRGGDNWFYDSNAPDVALGVVWTIRL